MLASRKVSPRTTQAVMRDSDLRLTAVLYTDEKLLPSLAELRNVSTILARHVGGAATVTGIPLDVQSLLANLSAQRKEGLVHRLRRAVGVRHC